MAYLEGIYNIELKSSEIAIIQIALEDLLEKKQDDLRKQDNPFDCGSIEHDIRKIKIIRERIQEEITDEAQ